MSGFLLDTNVISAFAKPEANEPVIRWLETTAAEHDLTMVTRNVKDFGDSGLSILNPWEESR